MVKHITNKFAYIVEVVETIKVNESYLTSRKVVGIFRDLDSAEMCRRLQPEFKDTYEGLMPRVTIRNIETDL